MAKHVSTGQESAHLASAGRPLRTSHLQTRSPRRAETAEVLSSDTQSLGEACDGRAAPAACRLVRRTWKGVRSQYWLACSHLHARQGANRISISETDTYSATRHSRKNSKGEIVGVCTCVRNARVCVSNGFYPHKDSDALRLNRKL